MNFGKNAPRKRDLRKSIVPGLLFSASALVVVVAIAALIVLGGNIGAIIQQIAGAL